jgi:diaminohydroxyphosphoribosylaminopyrimidine deaminase/5-amino-6-(5-phosphoribosylamino)uracil reductase
VAGKGIAILREHGIEVETQVCKAECDAINEIFFKYITTKQPYVILKTAMTCDGKTATYSGKSKWITNERSRRHTHFTRKRAAAIMVGIGTVLADDPELSCRIEDPSDPVRVVCDSGLRIPLDSRLVKTASRIPLIVATLSEDEEKKKKLEALGVIVYKAKEKAGRVDIRDVCTYLGSRGLDSLLVEGGSSLHGSFVDEGLVDMVQVYIGAKIFGGKMAATAIGGRGAESPDMAMKLSAPEVTLLDGDVLLEYRVIKKYRDRERKE